MLKVGHFWCKMGGVPTTFVVKIVQYRAFSFVGSTSDVCRPHPLCNIQNLGAVDTPVLLAIGCIVDQVSSRSSWPQCYGCKTYYDTFSTLPSSIAIHTSA